MAKSGQRMFSFVIAAFVVCTLQVFALAAADGEEQSITDDAPRAWFTFSPSAPKPGELITFDATPSQGESTIISYQWDTTGDGAQDRAGTHIRTSFPQAGAYPVTLTLHDALGRVAKMTRIVRVGTDGNTTLVIHSEPSGLTVYIDGVRQGQTPLELQVEPGIRNVVLRHYWLSDWETTLDLRHVSQLSLDVVLHDM